ncbi:hypothetical protein GJ496_010369 [Pomphorhynchus laevis]|nr:hypothetical protein GJ496_010369 [Pomphorhynchus laevis]
MTTFLFYLTQQSLVYDKLCLLHFGNQLCNPDLNPTVESKLQRIYAMLNIKIELAYTIPSIMSTFIYNLMITSTYARMTIVSIAGIRMLTSISDLLIVYDMIDPKAILPFTSVIRGFFSPSSILFMLAYDHACNSYVASRQLLQVARTEVALITGSTLGLILSGPLLALTNYCVVILLSAGIYGWIAFYAYYFLNSDIVNVHFQCIFIIQNNLKFKF